MIGLFLLLVVVPIWANCPHDVSEFAAKLLQRDEYLHSTWRVNISLVEGDDLIPVFSNMASIFSVPASNNKVITTSAAFHELGPNFKSETTAYLSENVLCIHSGGDASLSHLTLASFASHLAPALPKNVQLVIDDSYFGFQSCPGGWEWADMFFDYGAPPTATVLEHNTITLIIFPSPTVGAPPRIAMEDRHDAQAIQILNNLKTSPPGSPTNILYYYNLWRPGVLILDGQIALNSTTVRITPAVHDINRFGMAFAAHLADHGITASTIETTTEPRCQFLNNPKKLAVFPSPPLTTIMNHTLQTSDNLEAEIWLRHLGTLTPDPTLTNYQNGINKIIQVHKSRGIDTSRFYQTDGSGLGRSNLVQPDSEVEILYIMRNQPQYISMLPVGGESGTLAGRFIGTPAQGRVHAKTGTLTGVNALSGYVFPRNFKYPVIFSIIVNDSSNIPNALVRKGMDEIIVEVAKLTSTDC